MASNLTGKNQHLFYVLLPEETWGRFRQQFTGAFFILKCFVQLSLHTFQLCNFWPQNIGSKWAHKMLMKLALEREIILLLFIFGSLTCQNLATASFLPQGTILNPKTIDYITVLLFLS